MNGSEITRFLHSRYGYLLMMLGAVASAVYCYTYELVAPFSFVPGLLGIEPPSDWIAPGAGRLAAGLLTVIVTSALMVFVNSFFNVIRGLSLLYAGMYLVFTASVPWLMTNLSGGTLMGMLWVATLVPMFSSYQSIHATRRVFISFYVATTACVVFMPPAALLYIAVYFVGCIQMRCFNLKAIMAAITGIVTSLWILFGFGLTDLGSSCGFSHILSPVELPSADVSFYATAAITVVVGGIMGILSLIKIYSYNVKARAYNGFVTITAIATVALMLVDSVNVASYLPLLNVCAALQAGHFFTIYNGKYSFVGIIALILIYAALTVWNSMNYVTS